MVELYQNCETFDDESMFMKKKYIIGLENKIG